jgi:hypothetical protein
VQASKSTRARTLDQLPQLRRGRGETATGGAAAAASFLRLVGAADFSSKTKLARTRALRCRLPIGGVWPACRQIGSGRGASLRTQIGSASAQVVTPGLRVDLHNNLACRELVERLADRAKGNRCALVALDRTADLDGAHRTRRIVL